MAKAANATSSNARIPSHWTRGALAAVTLLSAALAVLALAADPRGVPLASATLAMPVSVSPASQAPATPPTMTVLVGTPHAIVPWRCSGDAPLRAELHGAAGLKASARVACFYGSTAYLDFRLDADGGEVPPNAPDYPAIASGDVVIVDDGTTRVAATVPVLEGDVAPDGSWVSGRLAPGTATTLDVFRATLDAAMVLWPYDDPEFRWWDRFRSPDARHAIVADAHGGWSLDLAGAGGLLPGDSALVEQRDAAGHRYLLGIAPPAVAVGMFGGVPLVVVQATNGARLAVDVAVPGAEPLRVARRANLWGWSPGDRSAQFSGSTEPMLPAFASEWSTVGVRERLPAGTSITLQRLDAGSDGAARPTHRLVTGAHDLDLDLHVVPGNGESGPWQVRGRAGAGTTAAVRVAGPLELQGAVTAPVDAHGAFTAALPAGPDPGWGALVAETAGPISAGSFLGRRHARVVVGSPFVVGTAAAGDGDITVTLRGGDGRVLGRASIDWSGWDGAWEAVVESEPASADGFGLPVVIEPGMVVEVAFDAGDPLLVPVFDITATVAADGSMLHGLAPPGAIVTVVGGDGTAAGLDWGRRVSRIGGLAIAAGAVVTAGLDGAWSVSAGALGLDRPIAAGDFGAVSVAANGGSAIAAGWGPIALTYDLDDGRLEGLGPPWSRPTVEMVDAAGLPVAWRLEDPLRDATHWGGGWSIDGGWGVQLVDGAGAPIQPYPGDALDVRFRGQRERVPIPPLTGVIHAAEGAVVGRALPGQRVACRLVDEDRGTGATITATADAAGRWQLDASSGGIGPITARHGARCRADVPPHAFLRTIAAPGLTLDLDQGLVEGRVTAGEPVTVARRHAGTSRLAAGRADPEGGFRAAVPDASEAGDGRPATPLSAGDVVTVTVPDPRGGHIPQAIDVPDFALVLDPDAGRIHVTAPASASIALASGAADAVPSWRSWEDSLTVPPTGRLDVDVVAAGLGPLSAGTRVVAALWLPSGHRLLRSAFVPQAAIPIDGSRACVLGAPGDRAAVELRRDGVPIGRAEADVGPAGAATLELVGEGNRPVPTRTGDVVNVSFVSGAGSGRDASLAWALTVPSLTWSVDWPDEVVAGEAAPGTPIEVAFTSRDGCQPAPLGPWLPGGIRHVVAGDDGRFIWRHEGDLAAGLFQLANTELQLRLPLPGGHAAVARSRALRADAHVGTARLSGEADPEARVLVRVERAAGGPAAEGEAPVGADGRWSLDAVADGRPAVLAPGDRVQVSSPSETTALVVQPLGLDVVRAGDVVGTAAPGAQVDLEAIVAPALGWRQPVRWLAVIADDRGAWTLPAEAGRRGWTLAEVVQLTASVSAEGRNRTIAHWSPVVDRPVGPAPLALPWLGRR